MVIGCHLCEKIFDDYNILLDHREKVHTMSKVIQCPECLVNFTRVDSLKRHMKVCSKTKKNLDIDSELKCKKESECERNDDKKKKSKRLKINNKETKLDSSKGRNDSDNDDDSNDDDDDDDSNEGDINHKSFSSSNNKRSNDQYNTETIKNKKLRHRVQYIKEKKKKDRSEKRASSKLMKVELMFDENLKNILKKCGYSWKNNVSPVYVDGKKVENNIKDVLDEYKRNRICPTCKNNEDESTEGEFRDSSS